LSQARPGRCQGQRRQRGRGARGDLLRDPGQRGQGARRHPERVHRAERLSGATMAEVNLTAAFSTVPAGDAEAIKRLLVETVEQIARDDGSFQKAKLVFTRSRETGRLQRE